MNIGNKIKLAQIIGLFAGVCASQGIWAQNEAEESAGVLEEVLVTATRREESLQEAGVAITNLVAEDFTDVGMDTLADITAYTPGINTVSLGQPGFGTINMRGVTQEAGTPIVAIYVDDMPYTNSNIGAVSSRSMFEGLLIDVERVEIVKGPQGTLYGANSVGGVIRYVTRDPALDELRGKVSVDFSDTHGAGDLNQRYAANISFPVIKETLGVTVSAFYSDRAGFIDQVDATGSPVDSEVNDSKSEGYSLAALWSITETASLGFSAIHTETEYSHLGRIPMTGSSPTFGKYETTEAPSPFSQKYDSLSLMLEIGFDWATLNWSLGTVESGTDAVSDITSLLPPIIFDLGFLGPGMVGQHPDTLDPANAPHAITNTSVSAFEKDVSEIRLTSRDSEKFEWIVGFFYTKEESDDEQIFDSVPSIENTNYGLFALPQTYEEKSLFANATYYITPDFDVSAGIRYTDTKLDVITLLSGGLLLGTVDPDLSVSGSVQAEEDVTTYMAGARWRLSEETALYFRASTGFRPGFINPPLAGSGLFVGSDSIVSYELGAKGNWLDGAVGYDFAIWSMTWEDFQAQINVGGIPTTGNANSDISGEGAEGTLFFNPLDDLTIRLALSYTNSELDEDDFAFAPATNFNISGIGGAAGDSTRFVPDWVGSLSADYRFALGGLDASVGGGIRYTSDFETTWSHSIYNPITDSNPTFTVPSSTVVDLNARVQGEKYALALYVNNLLDTYDFTNANVTGFSTTTNIVRPRTIGINLSYSF